MGLMAVSKLIFFSVETNLQPNGIDVGASIGSATALLSSLLAGDENFGRVLGNFVGLTNFHFRLFDN